MVGVDEVVPVDVGEAADPLVVVDVGELADPVVVEIGELVVPVVEVGEPVELDVPVVEPTFVGVPTEEPWLRVDPLLDVAPDPVPELVGTELVLVDVPDCDC